MNIRIPKPQIRIAKRLVGNVLAYAWECEHKTLDIAVLGNSKQDAIDNFKEAAKLEMVLSKKVKSETEVYFI